MAIFHTSYHFSFLEREYPDVVTVKSIGKSYEGRNLTLIKVCKGGCGKKPAIFIDGGIHAR